MILQGLIGHLKFIRSNNLDNLETGCWCYITHTVVTTIAKYDRHVYKQLSCLQTTVMFTNNCHIYKQLSCFQTTVMFTNNCHTAYMQ